MLVPHVRAANVGRYPGEHSARAIALPRYDEQVKRRLFYLRSKLARVLYRWFPVYKMHGAVGVLRRGERILVIDRADTMGYSFPGGLSKRNESGEQTVRRELMEETGLTMTGARFLFRYAETGGLSEFTSVYDVTAEGHLRGSGEGRPLWLTVPEIEAKLYPPQTAVLEFLKGKQAPHSV
jgi:8-oxo-dGTP pyrophosphatase MutT (NUDIX family)